MARASSVDVHAPLIPDDRPDDDGKRVPYDPRLATDTAVAVYRLSGAFFFGTASTVAAALDGIGDGRKVMVIDFSTVPFVDSTGANVIASLGAKAHRHGVRLLVSGTTRAVRRALLLAGARRPAVVYRATLEAAVEEARKRTTLR